MTIRMKLLQVFAPTLIATMLLLVPQMAHAQGVAALDDASAYLLNTILMIVAGLCAVLFILAYGLRDIGLARAQNAPAVCLRMLAGFSVSILAFWLSGYGLAFSVEEAGFLGEHAIWALNDDDPIEKGRASGVIWFFHTGLAAMAAAIVAASVSERVRLWAFLIFIAFLGGLIYPVAISWVWGGGYLAEIWRYGDFGGASLHIIAGAAGLAAAIVVGPRPGRFDAKSPWIAATTMMPLSVFAAGIGWIGLQGVFAGIAGELSSVEDGVRLGISIANISIATAAAVLTALTITQFVYDRPGLVTTMCAIIAGPVALAGDPVSPALWQAAMIGAVGGVIVSVLPPFLARFRIDDAGFVVPTHLLCGLWGAIIAAWTNPELHLLGQVVGSVAVGVFAFALSLFVWTALKYSAFGARQKLQRPLRDEATPPG